MLFGGSWGVLEWRIGLWKCVFGIGIRCFQVSFFNQCAYDNSPVI